MKDNTKSATQINTNLPIEIDIEQTMCKSLKQMQINNLNER